MTTDWIETQRPSSRKPKDVFEFFGIPPDTKEQLDSNIEKKRRYWHKKTNTNNAEGAKVAKQVKDLIVDIGNAVARGVEIPDPGVDVNLDETLTSIEDLWDALFAMLFNNDYDKAIRTARDSWAKWPESSVAKSAYAYVIATCVELGKLLDPQLQQSALDAVNWVLSAEPTDGTAWATKTRLLLANDDIAGALVAMEQTERNTGQLDPWIRSLRAEVFLKSGRAEEGLVDAVRAVHQSDDSAIVRDQCARATIEHYAATLLPISSSKSMNQYAEAVAVASWCAEGVADVEDFVRPHRLWAIHGSQRSYHGSWELRSLVAVASLFVLLPVMNRTRSRANWKVFLQGPDEKKNPAFPLVVLPEFVKQVHRPVEGKLSWMSGQSPQPGPHPQQIPPATEFRILEEGQRFTLGTLPGQYAIWNRTAPQAPTSVWPATPEGWQTAYWKWKEWEG